MAQSADVQYLNRFVRGLWPLASELLAAEVTHEVVTTLPDRVPLPTPWDARVSRSRTRLDASAPPAVVRRADGVRLRIPGSGVHTLRTRVYLAPAGPRPRVSTEIELAFWADFTADRPAEYDLEIEFDTNTLGSIADGMRNWQDRVEGELRDGQLAQELQFLLGARFDPSTVPDVAEPVLRYPDRPLLTDAVNLVLVPDRFDDRGLDRFESIVDAVVERLTTSDGARRNEPLRSFRSALHVWSVEPRERKLEGGETVGPFDDGIVDDYELGGTTRVALGNLARLARVGHVADAVGPGLTLMVVIADRRAFAGRRPRAMAMGSLVLQTTQADPAEGEPYEPDDDVDLLLHELGHTPLGDLADEYVEGRPGGGDIEDPGGPDDPIIEPQAAPVSTEVVNGEGDRGEAEPQSSRNRFATRYRGQPRDVPNITEDPDTRAWERWRDGRVQLPHWDRQPIVGVEGGGYFGLGLWRPAESCLMRDRSAGDPFCAVCREALTRGFRRALPEGQYVFEVIKEGDAPELVEVEVEDGATVGSAVVVVPLREQVDVAVTLVAASQPEPWELTTEFAGRGQLRTRETGGPGPATHTWSFAAAAGDQLTVNVGSTSPFAPFDPSPAHSLALHFEPDPLAVRPPATPEQVTGRQTSSGPPGTAHRVRLSGVTSDPSGQDVRMAFDVVPAGQTFLGRVQATSGWLTADGAAPVVAEVDHTVHLEGPHRVRARSENRSGRTSGWSDAAIFTVTPLRPPDGGDDPRGPGHGDPTHPLPP